MSPISLPPPTSLFRRFACLSLGLYLSSLPSSFSSRFPLPLLLRRASLPFSLGVEGFSCCLYCCYRCHCDEKVRDAFNLLCFHAPIRHNCGDKQINKYNTITPYSARFCASCSDLSTVDVVDGSTGKFISGRQFNIKD